MTEQVGHLIDGYTQPSLDGRTFQTRNPATGAVLADVAFGGAEDVDAAVQAAWRAFDSRSWRDLAPAERARRLRALALLVRDDADALARTESSDSGKPLTAARSDVIATAGLLDFVATLPEHVRGAVYAEQRDYLAYSRRVPYGVVGAIAPWNFPFMLAAWKTAPALAVGNSVVLKMAEQTPLSTVRYGQLAIEAGIPPGVLNIVHGDGPTTGAALAAHPSVPKITFTGSTEVGRAILRAASDGIQSCHLELGGKNANIVLPSADLDQALAGSLFTSFFHGGQICTSGSRLLVHESVADELLDRLRVRAGALRIGDPLDAATQIGPLITPEHADRVREYVRSGLDDGATLLVGNETPQIEAHLDPGGFVAPTVFTEVDPQTRIAQEEIFGPVLSVLRFSDVDQAVALANDVSYGLATTVWTARLDEALSLADRLDTGIVWTNCTHHLQWHVPYEGAKQSGLGEDLGVECTATFTRLRVHYVHGGSDRLTWADP